MLRQRIRDVTEELLVDTVLRYAALTLLEGVNGAYLDDAVCHCAL